MAEQPTDLTIPEGTAMMPREVLAAATEAAKALTTVLAKKSHKVIINGQQYLEFEDWQTVGQFYGYTVKTYDAEPVVINEVKGARARADLIDFRTGIVVGGAEAYCLSDERNWGNKPWFQLASMAQTRAASKALRNRLAWVVVLAGFKPTPAEEMTEIGQVSKPPVKTAPKAPSKEHWPDEAPTPVERITREQKIELDKLVKEQNINMGELVKKKGWLAKKMSELSTDQGQCLIDDLKEIR